MEVIFSDRARKELESLSEEMILLFLMQLEKMQEMLSRRNMMHGIPSRVEKVAKQAR